MKHEGMPKQLILPFMPEMDQRAAEAREVAARRMKRANQIAILRAHVHQYPLTEYERQVIPKGVRPARFVIGWECEVCPYACEDHSLGNKFGFDLTGRGWGVTVPCVCLKDYYEKGYGDKDHA